MRDVIMGRRIVIWFAVGLAMTLAFATGFELHSRSVSSEAAPPPRPTSTALRTAVLAGLEQGYYKQIPKSAYAAHSVTGVIRTLDDPYTEYLTPAAYQDLLESERGSFAGVGVELSRVHGGLLVRGLLPGLPASKAGIHRGDVVTAVGGRSLQHVPYVDAVELMHGAPGTPVRLQIDRPGREHPLLLTLVRQPVTVSAVTSRVIQTHGRRVLLVRIPTFIDDTASRVRQIVAHATAHKPLDGVILDLRGDTGGVLTEGVGVARVLIDHGVIVATDGQREPRQVFSGNGSALKAGKVAVLIDYATASAAEIVAGALKAHGAVVAGSPSYGKGTVQAVRPLPGGGALKLTVASFTLAGGRIVNGRGVTPTVDAPDLYSTPTDETLAAALSALRG
jgi:carboxyl-terminal processing protease